jgi:hypothetical protein
MQFANGGIALPAGEEYQDFQRAASTKRLKTPDAYSTGGILKKSTSTPDLAGLTLATAGNSPSRTETAKVQFDEATLSRLAAERAVDKIRRPPLRKGLKRSAQSCPDLAALAEEGEEEDLVVGAASNEPRRHLTVPISDSTMGNIPAFDAKKLKRIVSCPEFLDVYEGLQTEDERKSRRLARNRASARLRRQRKRLMADILEVKVKKLEQQIEAIKGLDWTDHEKLNRNSLGVDMNHPEFMDEESRKTTIAQLVKGIRAHIDGLASNTLRMSLLGWAGGSRSTSEANCAALGYTPDKLEKMERLRADMVTKVGLTEEQLKKMNGIELASGATHEFTLSVYLKQCLYLCIEQGLKDLPVVDNMNAQLSTLCQEGQKKKFLTWSAKNAISIGGLDICGQKFNVPDAQEKSPRLKLQTNSSVVDGGLFGSPVRPSGDYFPTTTPVAGSNGPAKDLPVFFFGGRDSIY